MIFCEQTALDQGRLQLAWLLTGLPEPNAQMMFSHRHRPGLKPFARLAAPSWVSANLAYLKDLDDIEGRMTSLQKNKQSPGGAPNATAEDKDKKKGPKGKGKGKQQQSQQAASSSGAAAADAA